MPGRGVIFISQRHFQSYLETECEVKFDSIHITYLAKVATYEVDLLAAQFFSIVGTQPTNATSVTCLDFRSSRSQVSKLEKISISFLPSLPIIQ